MIKILAIVFLSIDLMSIISCKDEETVEPVITVPVLTTVSISEITQTSAVSGGTVTDDGGAAVTARGVCYGTSSSPTTSGSKTTDGSGTGTFASSISGLTVNTQYFVRAYATNSKGTSYGNEVSFTTSPVVLATLTTAVPGSVTSTTAVSGGTITDDGGGDISARGVCWSKTQNPTVADSKTTDGTGAGNFVSNIKGLDPATNYYIRAYATNSAGTAYGNEVPLTTLQLKDADGNLYTSVAIGTQVWMVENLKTTKYNDNTSIPLITDQIAPTTPGYSWYDNDDVTYMVPYGALYNWYAVDTKKLCPAGWHVPTNTEWTTMVTYLGGEDVAGRKLKEVGSAHWNDPNDATNESGFTALPGGIRLVNNYQNITAIGQYWSSTKHEPVPPEIDEWAYSWLMDITPKIYKGQTIQDLSASVRCIRD